MSQWIKDELREFGSYISSNTLTTKSNNQPIDIAFIGAGLSSTFTLIEVINQLEDPFRQETKNLNPSSLNIAVFEKDDWVWGGIPYGRRSGFTSLIITPLDEFLPESELYDFIEWMSENIDWLKVPFIQSAGIRSKKWLAESEQKIRWKDSKEIHIPRYFFGLYILEKLKVALSRSSLNIQLNFINEEVISISKNDKSKNGKFIIASKGKIKFLANQIMLGVGMPQTKSFARCSKKIEKIKYFDDPYKPDLNTTLQEIGLLLKNQIPKKILIIGANASSLELIYQITNFENFQNSNTHISVLSPQGKLPNLFIKDKETNFVATNLQLLSESSKEITADSILEAFKKDLEFGDTNQYDISDTLPIFTGHVGNLIQRLSHKEKSSFIAFHGIEIGRLQRRAGLEYSSAVKELIDLKKLNIIKGQFVKLFQNDKTTGIKYSLENKKIVKENFDIVINCAGSSGLTDDGKTPLLSQLIDSGICMPTPSNHGILTGNNFDVLPGLFINGPLLAGNIIGDMGIWHVEHCGRIISFAKRVASNIINEALSSSLNNN